MQAKVWSSGRREMFPWLKSYINNLCTLCYCWAYIRNILLGFSADRGWVPWTKLVKIGKAKLSETGPDWETDAQTKCLLDFRLRTTTESTGGFPRFGSAFQMEESK